MPSITDVMKNTRVYLLWPVTPQLPSRSCNVTHHQVSTNTTSLKQYMAPSLKSVLRTTEVGHYALKYHYDITRSSKLLGLNYMPDFHLAHPSTSTKIINIARWVHSPLDQVPQGEQLAWTTHSGYIYHYAGNEMTWSTKGSNRLKDQPESANSLSHQLDKNARIPVMPTQGLEESSRWTFNTQRSCHRSEMGPLSSQPGPLGEQLAWATHSRCSHNQAG